MTVYVYRRRVQWGDADPAEMAYTVRFLDFAMDAIDSWYRDEIGCDWFTLNVERQFGSPAVHLELDFKAPLRPGDEIEIRVFVEKVGTSSVTLRFDGRFTDGRPVYEGCIVNVFVDRESLRSAPIPSDMKARIEAYAASQ